MACLPAFIQYQTGFITIDLYYKLRSALCYQAPTSGKCGADLRTRPLALPGLVSTGPLSLQQNDIRGKYRARTSATGYPGSPKRQKTCALVVSMTNRYRFLDLQSSTYHCRTSNRCYCGSRSYLRFLVQTTELPSIIKWLQCVWLLIFCPQQTHKIKWVVKILIPSNWLGAKCAAASFVLFPHSQMWSPNNSIWQSTLSFTSPWSWTSCNIHVESHRKQTSRYSCKSGGSKLKDNYTPSETQERHDKCKEIDTITIHDPSLT